jgi:ornithine cyclodeaminase/alanine dehydrogenase-like protein (mu-crystallin family)
MDCCLKNIGMSFLTLTDEDVKKSITMAEAIEAMVGAFTEISSGEVDVPVRSALASGQHNGTLLSMPAFSKVKNLFSVKVVSVFPENRAKATPTIQGKVMLVDGKNGRPLALIDAAYLTALRTGAASGLATKLFSQPDALVLAVFGTGAQAFTQVEGVLAVRGIKKILVKGQSAEGERKFCNQITEAFSLAAVPFARADDLLNADIICTATNSMSPVFEGHHVKPGAHINAIGGYRADMQEVPSSVLQHALLIVDQRKAVLEEAGDIVIPIREKIISANAMVELGECLADKTFRKTDGRITFFKSVGNAAQDLAIGDLLIRKYNNPFP